MALGVFFFLIILAVEYFLWLNGSGRLILFLLFLGVELLLAMAICFYSLNSSFQIKEGNNSKTSVIDHWKTFSGGGG